MKKIIIAIDGYSSTGKSTVAKQLAAHLGYVYVDTGAMYRAVTYFAMQRGFISGDNLNKEELLKHLQEADFYFKYNPELEFSEMYLNGQSVENEIRGMEVSGWVSRVAEIPEVRAFLVEKQKDYGKQKALVMDGRDIGTVVFPDAELKLFMTASAQTRAERRYKELKAKGEEVSLEEVIKNIEERDLRDTTRADSPLRMADDAIEIDNSNLNREEQFDLILDLVKSRIQN